MVDKGKVILYVVVFIILVFGAIEYIYGLDKCCPCCKEVAMPGQGITEVCSTKDGCCRCSFIKETFGIDIYFWKK